MISSLSSGISSLNANAMKGARGKELQLHDYWTSERMQKALPLDMGIVAEEPPAEDHVAEQSETPQNADLDYAPQTAAKLYDYWTAERMQKALPLDMGIVV